MSNCDCETLFTCRRALNGNNQMMTTCFLGLNSVNTFMEDRKWTVFTVLKWGLKSDATAPPCMQSLYQSCVSEYLIGVLHQAALQTWTWMEKKTRRQVVQSTGLIHTLVCLLCAKERKCSASHVELTLFIYSGLFVDRCGHWRCPTFHCTLAKTSCTFLNPTRSIW